MLFKFTSVLVGALLLSVATLTNALPKIADIQTLSDDAIVALVREDMSILEDPDLHDYIKERLSSNPKYSKYTGAQERPAVLNGQQCEDTGDYCDSSPAGRRILAGLEERAASRGENQKFAPLRRALEEKICCDGLICSEVPNEPDKVCIPQECRPASKLALGKCTRRRQKCAQYDIPMKWTGRGCRKNGKITGDGGCQCAGYCGYSCKQACNSDKECKWNSGVCQVKASGENGTAIPVCPVRGGCPDGKIGKGRRLC